MNKLLIIPIVALPLCVWANKPIKSDDAIQVQTIKTCTELLPHGHQYHLNIDINIDKKHNNAFAGSARLSDETKKPLALSRKKEMESFSNCIKNTIGK